jgi:hypothetical protein
MESEAMAQKTACETLRVEVRFRNAGSAGSCLAEISKIPGVLFHILRGRVTAREAVYQLELTGRNSSVSEAVWSLRAGASCP